MKLLIAVPCMDYLDVAFVRSLTALVQKLTRDGVDFELRLRDGSLVYCARDDLSFEAFHEGFTHVLWLDSDIVFDDDIFDRLYKTGKSFVSGVCRSRRRSFGYCVYRNLEPAEKHTSIKDRLFMIDGCGFAAVLIETKILKDVWDANNETCFTPTQDFGEDLQFCFRARKLGYRIYCEPAVKCGHVGRVVVRPEDDIGPLNEYQKNAR